MTMIERVGRGRRSSRLFGVAAGVLVSALLLAGCGDDSGADDAAGGSGAETISEADALGVVEAYHEAAAAGDADAIAATFAEAPVIAGSANVAEGLNFLIWEAAQGTVLVDRTCSASSEAESAPVVVVCEYGNHQHLQQVVGAPATPVVETITVTVEGIMSTDQSYAPPLFPANEAFNAWMQANHPDDAAAADCCGEDGSMEEARTDGELRHRYADLWAIYLEESGCTYTDIGC